MILLLGSAGQLGRDFQTRLEGKVVCWTRTEVDLSHFDSVRAKLMELKPRVVMNCAAYNFVDQAESEPEAAFQANAWAVRNLALACAELDATLVHFSTDYVFGLDASREQPWSETEAPGPVSIYGMSKLTGEYLVRSLCPKHFVIRTCGLYGVWGSGGKGGNFVETMLRMAGQGKPLSVVNDQRCTPSFTSEIAGSTLRLLETSKYGLYHLTNSGDCSWYEFAAEIFNQAGVSVALTAIPSREYPRPAKRPSYSVLSLDKFTSLGLPSPRPWQEALGEYLQERKKR